MSLINFNGLMVGLNRAHLISMCHLIQHKRHDHTQEVHYVID